CVFFFFNDTATTEIYTLFLHDALPISNTERIKYDYQPPPPREGRGAGGGRRGPNPGENPVSSGGGRPRGVKARTGVNNDPMVQPDEKLRALDTPPSVPG